MIEPLESRIAPASVSPFNDVDGDLVTITISTVTENDIIGAIFLSPVIGQGQHLVTLDLRAATFEGANVAITATRDPAAGGDGTVNVGYLQATGRDLGTVFVEGDLGVIDAGDPAKPASALKGLTVHSLGVLGTSTGALSLVSIIDGQLDKLTVKSDVKDAFLTATGKIGTVFVGGSIIGGAADGSGQIRSNDSLGKVTIKGDVVGGLGTTSGSVTAGNNLAAVTVGGSILGGSGLTSGVIFTEAGLLGPVKVTGSIIGGSADNAGRVFGKTGIVSVTVGKSLIGGIDVDTGKIESHSAIGPVKIAGSVIGGKSPGATRSGAIEAARIGAITIGESLIGGPGDHSGKITSATTLGFVKIGADIKGGGGSQSGMVKAADALPGITVGGSLDGGQIQSDGTMGLVKIGGNIAAGSTVFTGRVYAVDSLAGVTVGGSLIGAAPGPSAGSSSGAIQSDGTMGPVKIAGDVIGGSIDFTGQIFAQKTLASVTIGGSLIGGFGPGTGEIMSIGTLGPVKIGGDIVGGSPSGFRGTGGSGSIQGQRIVSVFVGGSVRAGLSPGNTFANAMSGSIRAADDIGSITIKGNLLGAIDNDGDPSDGNYTPAVIAARGQSILTLPPGSKTDIAIKSITIGGRVEMAEIRAGYAQDAFPLNADAQIGTVTVGGDWISSNLLAGVEDGANNIVGDSDDEKIINLGVGWKDEADLGGNGAISKIASVVIKGRALGTADNTDLAIFGIEAQQIVSLKIAGLTVPLTAGAGNDLHAARRPLSATFDAGGDFDFHAFEVAVAP